MARERLDSCGTYVDLHARRLTAKAEDPGRPDSHDLVESSLTLGHVRSERQRLQVRCITSPPRETFQPQQTGCPKSDVQVSPSLYLSALQLERIGAGLSSLLRS